MKLSLHIILYYFVQQKAKPLALVHLLLIVGVNVVIKHKNPLKLYKK